MRTFSNTISSPRVEKELNFSTFRYNSRKKFLVVQVILEQAT